MAQVGGLGLAPVSQIQLAPAAKRITSLGLGRQVGQGGDGRSQHGPGAVQVRQGLGQVGAAAEQAGLVLVVELLAGSVFQGHLAPASIEEGQAGGHRVAPGEDLRGVPGLVQGDADARKLGPDRQPQLGVLAGIALAQGHQIQAVRQHAEQIRPRREGLPGPGPRLCPQGQGLARGQAQKAVERLPLPVQALVQGQGGAPGDVQGRLGPGQIRLGGGARANGRGHRRQDRLLQRHRRSSQPGLGFQGENAQGRKLGGLRNLPFRPSHLQVHGRLVSPGSLPAQTPGEQGGEVQAQLDGGGRAGARFRPHRPVLAVAQDRVRQQPGLQQLGGGQGPLAAHGLQARIAHHGQQSRVGGGQPAAQVHGPGPQQGVVQVPGEHLQLGRVRRRQGQVPPQRQGVVEPAAGTQEHQAQQTIVRSAHQESPCYSPTTRIWKLSGTIVGRGWGTSLVTAGTGPNSAVGR